MTIQETRCDACDRTFQTLDRPVLETAQSFGWHVSDIVLCPCCCETPGGGSIPAARLPILVTARVEARLA